MASIPFFFLVLLSFNHVMSLGSDEVFFGDRKIFPTKIIDTEEGDIVDCVDFYSQPAFRDPAIRHRYEKKQILRSSTTKAVEETNVGSRYEGIYAWRKDGGCPKGTIPIWRSNKYFSKSRQYASAKGFSGRRSWYSSVKPTEDDERIHEYAALHHSGGSTPHRGIKANISVWQPWLGDWDEMSLAQLWAAARTPTHMETVEVGWQVCPDRFDGDIRPHLFVFTTAGWASSKLKINDSYTNFNCYDDECGGFVVDENTPRVPLRHRFPPSMIDGAQREYEFTLEMNPEGDWMFLLNGELVGSWPHSTLPRLSHGASFVQWGGEIEYSTAGKPPQQPHTTTQMGSGRFPSEGIGKAAHFSNLKIRKGTDEDHGEAFVAPPHSNLRRHVNDPACYDLLDLGLRDGMGYTFLYGGSGGDSSGCNGGATASMA